MSAHPDHGATEWRVCMRLRGHEEPLTTYLNNEDEARKWAELERADYPHYEVWIESREVTPWRRATLGGEQS